MLLFGKEINRFGGTFPGTKEIHAIQVELIHRQCCHPGREDLSRCFLKNTWSRLSEKNLFDSIILVGW